MSRLQIVMWPEEVLTTKAKPVKEFDANLAKFAADMHETMVASGGIGLAANQVGELKRVLTVLIPWVERFKEGEEPQEKKWWYDKKFTFVNPEITKKSGKIKWQEGCLSFPELYDYVDRASHVTVKAFDEFGKPFEVEADELFAVCLQHEIDHLDGIVFVDRMSRLKAQFIKKKMLQRKLSHLEVESNS